MRQRPIAQLRRFPARVFVVNPSFRAPDGKRLGGTDAEHAEPQHLLRAKFGTEGGIEIAPMGALTA
jgi:hypothetical protein